MKEEFFAPRGIAYRTNAFLPGRPTLLLIHGFAGSVLQWADYEPLWENKFNLVIPDLRGHGQSKHWPEPADYAPELMADDFAALLTELKIEKCIPVGYSLGSYVALAFWLKHSPLVQKMILVGPLYKFVTLWRVRLMRPLFALLAFFGRGLSVGDPGSRIGYAKWVGASDENIGRIFADFRHTGARSYFYNLEEIAGFAEDDAWQKITCPTLILYGEKDDFMPRTRIDALAACIPHATLTVIPRANHLMVINNPKEVAKAIEDFIQ